MSQIELINHLQMINIISSLNPYSYVKINYNSLVDLINRIISVKSTYRLIVGRVFANDPGDLGSIPGRVIPKTLKIVLDTSLLNTQQYKVGIEGKMEQSRKRNSALPYASV